VAHEGEPLDDLNKSNRVLEQLNRELGFLNPYDNEEEMDRISAPGRVRILMEIWTLAYLGLSRRY
jgi:hypothetical protein